jgi:energy-converting hydrogenase Eha subunit F
MVLSSLLAMALMVIVFIGTVVSIAGGILDRDAITFGKGMAITLTISVIYGALTALCWFAAKGAIG